MTPAETEQVKAAFDARYTALETKIAQLKLDTAPIEPSNSIGRLSRLDAINNKSVAENTLRQYQRDIEVLRHRISQYGTEDFGKCTRCGQEIILGRLLRMPESSHCIRCANR